MFEGLPHRKSATLERAMKSLVPRDGVLSSDGASAYAKVAAQREVEHFVVGGKPGARVAAGSHHIQNVNSPHARYEKCIRPFCGPARKNLNGRIRWREVRLAGMTDAELIRSP